MYGQMPAGRGQETEIFPACAAHARMLGLPAKLAPREFDSSIGVVAVVYKPCPTTICPLTTRQRRRIIWRASSDPSASKGSRRSTTGLWARPFPSGAAEQTSTLETFCAQQQTAESERPCYNCYEICFQRICHHGRFRRGPKIGSDMMGCLSPRSSSVTLTHPYSAGPCHAHAKPCGGAEAFKGSMLRRPRSVSCLWRPELTHYSTLHFFRYIAFATGSGWMRQGKEGAVHGPVLHLHARYVGRPRTL